MARSQDGKLMEGADNVYSLVGGAVQQARINNPTRTANTCALKVSIALVRSGIIIPMPVHLKEVAIVGNFFSKR
jgi:hypothetical protein